LAAARAGEWLTEQNLADLRVTVVHAGPDLHVRAHSPGQGVMAGSQGGSLCGQSVTDVFPELIGCEEELLAVARGESASFEMPLVNRSISDDSPRYLSLTGIADPEIEGGLVLLVHDDTERGILAQQLMQNLNEVRLLRGKLEAANARLVRLDAEKSDFLRMAAHDLRSPLAIIRGYVELVLQLGGSGLGTEITEYLDIVLARSRQMASLIDTLLDVERIEQGEAGLVLEPVDLSALVAQAVEGFRVLAKEGGLQLQAAITEVPAIVAADRARLGQVMSNLLSNAIKFTPAGGCVTVELLVKEKEAIVEVSDTGPGIAEADQAHLFQRFFRSDDARVRGVAGHGLGLPIVRAIVEQHGGRVFWRSRPGQGSTFGFGLPLA